MRNLSSSLQLSTQFLIIEIVENTPIIIQENMYIMFNNVKRPKNKAFFSELLEFCQNSELTLVLRLKMLLEL